jgi:ComF family protein
MPLADTLISIIAPYDCLVCGHEGKLLCGACQKDAIIAKPAVCYLCGRLSERGVTCQVCRRKTPLAGVTVASYYDGAIKELIHQIKFTYARSGSEIAAELVTPLLTAADYDIVTSIPAAPARLRERGYNQAQLIAKHVARQLGLPYADLLVRTRNLHQVGSSRTERLEHIQGAFVAARPQIIKGARILLVDDVVTTGATLGEAASILHTAGATQLWGAAVARH